jgi:hypothetical protein
MIFHAEVGMNIPNYQIFRWEQRGTTVLIPVSDSCDDQPHNLHPSFSGDGVWNSVGAAVGFTLLESGEVVFGGPVLIVYIYINSIFINPVITK